MELYLGALSAMKKLSQALLILASVLLALSFLSCDQPQRSLRANNEGGNPGPEKPEPTIPPNYDPHQFVANSSFVFRETVQSLDDGKTWSEVQKNCYLWVTTEIKENLVTFDIRKQFNCADDYLPEGKWSRTITFVTITGEIFSDLIKKGSETIPGELNNKTIAPIFFTNRKIGLEHQLLKEFKVDQKAYSGFRIGDSVYWNNPETPVHSLLLYQITPGPKGSNLRTLFSLVEARPSSSQ